MVVVDSVQSIYSDAIQSGAGSVTQVRDCSAQLLRLAKSQTFPLFLVGHVTKEGAIAGPRVLEHMVDTVLYLEGERFHSFRLLRSVKNRFGSTNEVGVFEMAEKGLVEVKNPSEAFLAERLPNAAGSAIAVTMEGTRPILVEVQALTSATAFAQPRRTANGVDFNRLLLITAVLSKRARVRLADQDVFVNVVGGLEVEEPAADLAIAAAIASSVRNRPVAADLALVGEIGLSGELRSVGQLPRRLNEAAKLGFTRVLVPKTVARKLEHPPAGPGGAGRAHAARGAGDRAGGGGRGGGAGELRGGGAKELLLQQFAIFGRLCASDLRLQRANERNGICSSTPAARRRDARIQARAARLVRPGGAHQRVLQHVWWRDDPRRGRSTTAGGLAPTPRGRGRDHSHSP